MVWVLESTRAMPVIDATVTTPEMPAPVTVWPAAIRKFAAASVT